MKKAIRPLLFLVLLLPLGVFAAIPTTIKVSFSNQNWFPLEVEEMKAACVDTALDELTRNGDFSILNNETSEKDNSGNLSVEIMLIERAQLAQVKLALTIPGEYSTYVTHASGSLAGKDYQGIYAVFENIGRKSAKDLLTRLEKDNLRHQKINQSLENSIRKLEKAADRLSQPELKLDAAYNNQSAEGLYHSAQELKLSHQFAKAEALFIRVSNMKEAGTSNWAMLSKDELRYGLPTLQADVLTRELQTRISNKQPIENLPQQIDQLYDSIIKQNPDKPERIQTTQMKRDQFQQMTHYLRRAQEHQAIANLMELKIYCLEYMQMTGEFPPKSDMERNLQASRRTKNFKILSHQVNGKILDIVLVDTLIDKKFAFKAELFDYIDIKAL